MPGVELSPEQATLVLRYILDNPPLRNEDHKAKYAQIAAKLSYAIAQSPNFGTTAAKRTELEQACGKAFTREHYKHFMEFFGYRVAYRDEAA